MKEKHTIFCAAALFYYIFFRFHFVHFYLFRRFFASHSFSSLFTLNACVCVWIVPYVFVQMCVKTGGYADRPTDRLRHVAVVVVGYKSIYSPSVFVFGAIRMYGWMQLCCCITCSCSSSTYYSMSMAIHTWREGKYKIQKVKLCKSRGREREKREWARATRRLVHLELGRKNEKQKNEREIKNIISSMDIALCVGSVCMGFGYIIRCLRILLRTALTRTSTHTLTHWQRWWSVRGRHEITKS